MDLNEVILNVITEEITGTTTRMEYSKDNGVSWVSCSNLTTPISLTVGAQVLVREKGNDRNITDLGSIAVGETGVEARYSLTQGRDSSVKQVETATVTSGATLDGGLVVNMLGLNWLVPGIKAGDTPEQVAVKIVGTFLVPANQNGYDLVATGPNVILTERVANGNDTSLNISIRGNGTGVPDSLISENTKEGLVGTATEKAIIEFTSGALSDGIIVISLNNLSYFIQVSAGDTAVEVTEKVRTLLGVKSVEGYKIEGAGSSIIVTSLIEGQDITPDLAFVLYN